MKKAVLFDLGNTLAAYYTRKEWPSVLEQSIAEVSDFLRAHGIPVPSHDEVWARVAEENHEAPDCRVRPLDGRLIRIFALDQPCEFSDDLCRAYLRTTFDMAYVYEDTIPVLTALRERGIRTAVVSNSPFGSPPEPWHEELHRIGIAQHVDLAVFCGDVGWRKPARPIFDHVLERLGVAAEDCIFVGDDPKWDIAGPRAVGIETILIDRSGAAEGSIRSLWSLIDGSDLSDLTDRGETT